jgi:hypothetical protein
MARGITHGISQEGQLTFHQYNPIFHPGLQSYSFAPSGNKVSETDFDKKLTKIVQRQPSSVEYDELAPSSRKTVWDIVLGREISPPEHVLKAAKQERERSKLGPSSKWGLPGGNTTAPVL